MSCIISDKPVADWCGGFFSILDAIIAKIEKKAAIEPSLHFSNLLLHSYKNS